MLSRVAGMGRDMMMAFAFGASPPVAAFMVAFRLAHLLRRVFGEGALQSAFIPHFEELRHENPQRAKDFFRDLSFTITLLLVGVILAALALCGATLIFVDLSAGNREIIQLVMLMLPSLLFICLYGLNASLLQCEGKYFLSSAAPIAFNILWIGGAYFLRNMPVAEAMSYLSIVIIISCLAQWLATVPTAFSLLKSCSLQFSISADVKALIKPISLGIIGIAATQLNTAMDAIFARYADPEGPALLWYAIRLQQLPIALFGIALSGALLPPLSRAAKSGQHEKFCHFLHFGIEKTVVLMIPITIAIFLLGERAINLLYGRGDFTENAVVNTYWCLAGYGIGILPMSLILLLAPAYYGQGNYQTPMRASVIGVLTNLLLNSVMIMFMGLGAASVALATSLSAFVNLAILWRGLHDVALSPIIAPVAKSLAASITGVLLTLIAFNFQSANVHSFTEQLTAFLYPSVLFMTPILYLWFSEAKAIAARS